MIKIFTLLFPFILLILSFLSFTLTIFFITSPDPLSISPNENEIFQTDTYYLAKKFGYDLSIQFEDIKYQDLSIKLLSVDSDIMLMVINNKIMFIDLNRLSKYLKDLISKNRVCLVVWNFIYVVEVSKIGKFEMISIKYGGGELNIDGEIVGAENFLTIVNGVCNARMVRK